MNRRKVNTETLEDSISSDPEVRKLIELLENFDDLNELENDAGNGDYKLPYSSDPVPTGKRWKTA